MIMERQYQSAAQALQVAQEAMWLAWTAAGRPSGMGILQDNPGADKNAVWNRAFNKGDYSGRLGMKPHQVYADYVFGRMLKLIFSIKGDTISVPDSEPQCDYQGWCWKYKTYNALFDAAETMTDVNQIPNK